MKSFSLLLPIIIILSVGCVPKKPNFPRNTSKIVQKSISSQNTTMDKAESKSSSIDRNLVMSGPDVFKKYNSAVFMVFTTDGNSLYQGSGFFISSNGMAISNYHVFEGTGVGYEIIKTSDNREWKINKVIEKDKDNDYIVFQVSNEGCTFNYIPVSSRKAHVGETIFAIGSPRGLENTFSSGMISQIREENIIQISAPIDHGSSGGALINIYGEAIGITSGGYDDSGANLNFAIDIRVIHHLIK